MNFLLLIKDKGIYMNKTRLINSLCFSFALLTPLFAIAESEFNDVLERKTLAKIDWQPCYQNENPNLLCALYPVPLNYQKIHTDKGQHKTINIALVKLPANNPAKNFLGSLFLNPGGPGGSGVEFVRFTGQYLFNQDVRDQYDLVGFDPRGINLSEPVSCGLALEQALEILPQTSFPVTAEEEAQKLASDKRLNAICRKDGNAIMDHMTTADVARDLDLLRQAVGDKLLNYVGYSYGSYLGVTYANMFPQNVGHLVVDGVLDPVQWSTGKGWAGWIVPVTTRLGSDKGSMATLQEFFRLCDLAGIGSCSFAGNSAARFDAMAQRLKTEPLLLILPDGSSFELTYAVFISTALGATYNSPSWSEFADLLAFAEAQSPPQVIGEKYSKLRLELGIEEVVTPFDNRIFSLPAVLCSDSTNPVDLEFWPLWAAETERSNGYFGRSWTWVSSMCPQWPGSQKSRFTGPFNRKTKNPVLVTNTLFDPATPYSGAQTVARLLPNSRLVTVAGWGHTTPGLSSCADKITVNYLLHGELPPVGTICNQEVMPFFIADGIDVFAGMIQSNDKAEHPGIANVEERVGRASAQHKSAAGDSDAKRVRKAILRGQNRRFQ
jgi:pimeloyl-ACP methyl ester carboxylesterase